MILASVLSAVILQALAYSLLRDWLVSDGSIGFIIAVTREACIPLHPGHAT